MFIGREPYWQRRFAEEGLPVIGDDIKSQVGATISHRVLTRLFMDRGVRLDRTYQLNFGGNTDFLNMLERERLESKKISKTNAVTSMLDYELDDDDVHVGPSDHVPWLKDRKWCYIRMEGTTFGDVPLNAELKLEVWDSPNSAGVITDAIRCLKLGLDRGLEGTLVAPSSYFMKSPPQQIHDDIAFNRVEAFIRGEDNETLVGTETPAKRTFRKLATQQGVRRGANDQDADRGEVTARERRARGAPPAPRARTRASSRRRPSSATRTAERLLGTCPRDPVESRGRPRRAGLVPALAARSDAGRTATSGTSSGCRPTTRVSAGWPCGRTASTPATWSSSCACRPARPPRSTDSRATSTSRPSSALRERVARRADPGSVGTSAATRRSRRRSPITACRSASSPTTPRSPSCSSTFAGSASSGA